MMAATWTRFVPCPLQTLFPASSDDRPISLLQHGRVRPNYKCGRCGQPKRGHVCKAKEDEVRTARDDAWDEADKLDREELKSRCAGRRGFLFNIARSRARCFLFDLGASMLTDALAAESTSGFS